MTVSIGVAVSGSGAIDTDDLVGRADAALYAAKAGGRDRVVVGGSQAADPRQRLRSTSASSRAAKAAISSTVASTSPRSTISTGECM